MTVRNMSLQEMFFKKALEHKPACRFHGKTAADFKTWRRTTLPKVIKCLGDFPEKVPAKPELLAEWEHDGLTKQRWIINVDKYAAATLQINIPGDLPKGEKRPTLLAWHGHGHFGKEPVMGNEGSDEMKQNMRVHNYSYGHKMAKRGFITYAIDWMGGGERCDSKKPNWHFQNGQRDWCNIYYLHATMLGMTPISMNVMQGMMATDFVTTLPFVDARRLGVMGLSGGGVMTLWTTLCDPRFKASEIMCYSDLWAYFGFRDVNYCGSQVAPGLYKLVDLPDLQGLIAPRPLLIDIGANDQCFKVDTALACYRQLENIYRAAGATENLELDFFPGDHRWGENKSFDFFSRHLRLSGK